MAVCMSDGHMPFSVMRNIMKTLTEFALGGIFALALGTSAALAQSAEPEAPDAGATEGDAELLQVIPGDMPGVVSMDDMTAEMLAGADVFSIEGNDIGQVSDIVFTSGGEMDQAVISFGGFLGFGRQTVALPLKELTILERVDSEGEMIVQVPLTEDQMEALPEYVAETENVSGESAPVTE